MFLRPPNPPVRAQIEARSAVVSTSVDISPVPEGDDDHQQDVVGDRVEDPVVADTDAIGRATPEGAGGGRPGIVGEERNRPLDTPADRRIEPSEGPDGGRAEFDPIAAHSKPRSAFT
jgi:hypothetical protein